jgi:hypothetical protein
MEVINKTPMRSQSGDNAFTRTAKSSLYNTSSQ